MHAYTELFSQLALSLSTHVKVIRLELRSYRSRNMGCRNIDQNIYDLNIVCGGSISLLLNEWAGNR